jgi:hypothetical protein
MKEQSYFPSKRRDVFKCTLHSVTTLQKISLEFTVLCYKNHRGKRKYSLWENVDNVNLGLAGYTQVQVRIKRTINVKQTPENSVLKN